MAVKYPKLTVNLSIVVLLPSCSADGAPPSASNSDSGELAPASVAPKSPSSAPTSANSKKYKPGTARGPAVNVPVPGLPIAAKEQSESGASAFAKNYFDLINYTVETNDPEPLKKYSQRKCEICGTALIDPAGRAQITGTWQVGGQHTYKVVNNYKPSKDRATVSVRFEVAESVFYTTPGKVESRNPKTTSEVAALSLEYDSGWKVDAVHFKETR